MLVVVVLVCSVVSSGAQVVGGLATSPNWSGYVVQSMNKFTQVVGSWVQPAVACNGELAGSKSAVWVGIDGYQNTTVEQIGTEANCVGDAPAYFAWWQMYPTPFTKLDTSSNPVRPGDRLTAWVSRSGDSYTLSLASSEGWSYRTVQIGNDSDSSAEWVVSSPPLCSTCGTAALSDFGKVEFTQARAAAGSGLLPISAYPQNGPVRLEMVGASEVTRAWPSILGPDGEGFGVAWRHS